MAQDKMGNILIIANARRKGGLSGSDNIYLAFEKYWPAYVNNVMHIDFRPFWLCYLYRIIIGCLAPIIFWRKKWPIVYSSSDFMMDVFPALIYKCKGAKWAAGYYMHAPKKFSIYWWTQQLCRFLINKFADVTLVTNESMYANSPGRFFIPVHGGIDTNTAFPNAAAKKEYDAVFIGRFHYTKGIKELMIIWEMVLKSRPHAKLAIIGGGDMEEKALRAWAVKFPKNVFMLGYVGATRFQIFRQSKIVLYPTPVEYSHFSMGPVEAMACGCPMIVFNLLVLEYLEKYSKLKGCAIGHGLNCYVAAVIDYIDGRWEKKSQEAIEWAQTWDWKVRAPAILKQIRRAL